MSSTPKPGRLRIVLIGCLSALILWVLALAVLVLLQGPDYHARLPEGYQIMKVYAGAVGITSQDGRFVVQPNVEAYAVISPLVVGRVVRIPKFGATAGYFILDCRTGSLADGLTKHQWLQALQKLGIKKEPKLHGFTRMDAFRLHARVSSLQG